MTRTFVPLVIAFVAAGAVDAAASGRLRRGDASPAARRVAAHDGLTTVDLQERLARLRLQSEIGEGWSSVLVTADEHELPGVLARHGGTWQGRGMGRNAFRPPAGADPLAWYLALSRDAAVLAVEPNYDAWASGCLQMSIDILQSGGRVDLTGQVAFEGMEAQGGLPAPGVVVAIVDSGIAEIDELDGRLLPAIDVLRMRGNASGSIDPNGHGTAMASLVASLAPDALLLPVRVVKGNCRGDVLDLAEGIRLAADAGAQVISVSLGVRRPSPVLAEAVAHATAAGSLVVAASGNDGHIEHPAALAPVLAVSAVDGTGWPASFAPVGTGIDVAAPGVDVLSVSVEAPVRLTGTSPAAAIVAAAAARAAALEPDGTGEDWRARVLSAARPAASVSPSLEGALGAGLVGFAGLR